LTPAKEHLTPQVRAGCSAAERLRCLGLLVAADGRDSNPSRAPIFVAQVFWACSIANQAGRRVRSFRPVWQHLIGLHLHWLVLPITFIILVAVGSDYNLLLIARVKEETKAGLNTGLIRALGSTGGVVTSAGWCSRSPCWRCSRAI